VKSWAESPVNATSCNDILTDSPLKPNPPVVAKDKLYKSGRSPNGFRQHGLESPWTEQVAKALKRALAVSAVGVLQGSLRKTLEEKPA